VIDPELAGRVALVTGANQGIGAAVATALATQGARVLLTYWRLPTGDPAQEGGGFPPAYAQLRAQTTDAVVARIAAAGGEATAVEADLTDTGAPARLFDAAERLLGPVEILVNNASGWLADTFLPPQRDRIGRLMRTVDADSYERQFAVDVRAAALLIAELARRHLDRGASWGRIIGLTSGGPGGFPQEVSYGAAKAAQENYTMSAAHELGRYGITANLVYPPVTDTGWVTPEVEAAAAAHGPLRHVARPEDVAEVVTFLASHQARYVTAQIVRMS
jgi:3-oxoacyl-[acyl-carrier protein] reductase